MIGETLSERSTNQQQEPKLLSFVAKDEQMCDAFQHGRDIYATIAGISFNMPYEKCLEFHPETHEYQPDGKARRSEAKTIVLGITYGRSVVTIAEQLFGTDDSLTQEQKTAKAQKVYDSVLTAFPRLRAFMSQMQSLARKQGYVETILGRRRHIPDMQLPEFEFYPMPGYVNPDINPLDLSTLANKEAIPRRIVNQLEAEFKQYKYFGQIARRTRELADQKIRVVNNRSKIQDASRKVVNSVVQGSAAELTKMAMLALEHDPDWLRIGGKLILPVHDELIAEVPIQYWKEGGEILSRVMSEAGSFLPFDISCDVTTTLRWYGLEYPCKYTKPSSIDTVEPDEVSWIQYHLVELEYSLPVFKEADGSKPRGDAAVGVNGRISDEYIAAIQHYMNRYKISSDQFIDHIDKKVIEGV